MKSPRAALFATLLLAAACDPGPGDRTGDKATENADEAVADEAPPGHADRVASASNDAPDDAPGALEDPDIEVGVPADAPEDVPTAVPAALDPSTVDEPAQVAAPAWFIKGSLASIATAGTAQSAAAQAGASVRVSLLSDAGELTLVGDAEVDLDGTFSVALPVSVDVDLGIAQLLDAAGSVTGSVIVGGAKGSVGAVLDLAPMSAESALEVDVLLAATRCGCSTAPRPSAVSLALDVSALVDADLSLALDAALDLGADVNALTRGLADAVLAAARARAGVLIDLDVKLDANALLDAQRDALGKLGRGLRSVAAGQAKLTDVLGDLSLALDGALSLSGGLDAELRVRTQLAGSLAFSSSLSAAFSIDPRLDRSLFAALRSSAVQDAAVTSNAVVDLLEKGGASTVDIQLGIDAGLKLRADVSLALDVEALVDARRAFVATLTGRRREGGLIGTLLGGAVDLVGGRLDRVLDTVLDLSIDLDATLALDLNL